MKLHLFILLGALCLNHQGFFLIKIYYDFRNNSNHYCKSYVSKPETRDNSYATTQVHHYISFLYIQISKCSNNEMRLWYTPVRHRMTPPREICAFFLFLVRYSTIYIGLTTSITPGSCFTKLYMPIVPMKRNQIVSTEAKL